MNVRGEEFYSRWRSDLTLKDNIINIFVTPFEQYAPQRKTGFFCHIQDKEFKEYENVRAAILADLRDSPAPNLDGLYVKICCLLASVEKGNNDIKYPKGQLVRMIQYTRIKIEEAVPELATNVEINELIKNYQFGKISLG